MAEDGEFRKVKTVLKSSMLTSTFLDKYFHTPVEGQWLLDKRPHMKWQNNRTIFYNDSGKGILLFY